VRGWNTRWVSLGVDQKTPSSCEMGVGYSMLKPAIGAGSVVLVAVWSQEPCHSPVGSSVFVSLCQVGAVGSQLSASCMVVICQILQAAVPTGVPNVAVLSMVSEVYLVLCVWAAAASTVLGWMRPLKDLGCSQWELSVILCS